MNTVAQLLVDLCPNGIPFKPMGEVGVFIRGNGMPKTDFVESGVGAIHYGQIYTYYGTWATKTVSFVDPATAKKLAKVDQNDLIITNTSENLEDVGKAVAWLGDEQIVTGGHASVFKHDQDAKFIAYWMQSPSFQVQKRKFATGTKVIDVSAKSLAQIKIPVPPIEVQREIVRILDTFSRLEAELEAELEARSQQYTFYRDRLLSFDEDVTRASFGDVATIVRGASPRPIQAFISKEEDGVPWIKIGDVPANGKYVTNTAEKVTPAGAAKSRRVRPGDFILSNSMSFGRPYIVKIEGCIHDGWLAISGFEEAFLPDFLYHLLRSKVVQAEFARKAGSGTVQNLNADIVRSVTVPVPSMDEQEKIVAILDRFEVLTNDLNNGLPAELNARRQQYEHYRDRLLTFQEATV